jgi:hypothetical protein
MTRKLNEGRAFNTAWRSRIDEFWCRYQNADAVARRVLPCLPLIFVFAAGCCAMKVFHRA